MKFFCTNQYNSLNIFNYCIIISIIAIVIHLFSDFSTLEIIPYIIILGTILLISYLAFDKKQKISIKNNFLQKFITFLTILFYFLIIALIICFFSFNKSSYHIFKNPNDYPLAIKTIKNKKQISHFPHNIPKNAKNIQFYCYTSDFNGEVILLKFKINKDYIQKELKNHKFINLSTPIGTKQNIYYVFNDNNRIKTENTTWYVIDNQENKQVYKKYFPYYSSIGISNNMDYIIYYYIELCD